jgi:large subunit ribosomal protein L29
MKDKNTTSMRDVRAQADGEINSNIRTKSEELQKLKIQLALGQMRQTHQIRVLRKEIARLKTVLGERRISA